MIASTSIEAYHSDKVQCAIALCKRRILNAMRGNKDYTIRELSDLTGIEKGEVPARITDLLKDKSIVRLAVKRKSAGTGINSHCHILARKQLELV